MAKTTEVKTKLTLDDAAAGVLSRIKQGFRETNEAQKQTQSGLKQFGQQMLATFAATNIVPFTQKVVDFGKSFFDVAAHVQDTDQTIRGLITGVQDVPWAQADKEARAFRGRLEDISIAAGQNKEDVKAGFAAMVELFGASEAGLNRAMKDIEKLTTISNVLGMTTESLSREYGFMSEGVLKTKGKLFQLLQPTGIFGNETKKAAEVWSKLTEEKRIELLSKGMGMVADGLGKATPTAHDLLNTLDNLWNVTKEKLGEPFLEAIMPELKSLVEEITSGRGAIEGFAKSMGKDVGKWVKAAADEVRRGYAYVREHYQELKSAIVEGFETAKKVVSWILAHKEEIAYAFGAKMALPLAGKAVGAVQAGAGAIKGAAALGGAVAPALQAGALGGNLASLTTALGGAAIGVGAFTLAIGAVALTAYATSKAIEDMNQEAEARINANQAIIDAANAGRVKEVEMLVEGMYSLKGGVNSLGQAIGEVDEQTAKFYQSMRNLAETTQRMQAADVEALQRQIDMATRGIEDAYMRQTSDTSKAAQDYANNMYANQAAMLVDAYNTATRGGNSAMAALAAQTLAGSKGVLSAFLASGAQVEGGFMAMSDLLMQGGSQFAAAAGQLRQMAGAQAAAAKPAAPTINMNGGQTFNIKQDFRDQDPDRIALVTRNSLSSAAINRTMARTSTAFGT